MIFASPAWLVALLALPLLAGLEVWLARRDRDRLARLVSRPLWGRVVRRTGERWRLLRLALLLLGAAGLVVALARPQWGIVREKVEREGVDVVLVLDTSGSMATADVAPSRFFLARQALLQLIARLEGDRFALVAFEGEAYPLVPLTLDADALGLFLETVEPGIVPAPGTSLGVGLAKGLEAFVDKERRNKVMVLVSDGEDLEGEVEEAVRRAKEAGVVVHAVGVGTEGGQPVPDVDAEGRVTGYKRDESGGAVVSRLNMATLDAIARGTGGKAFRITPADTSLSALASAIEGMEQKTLAREYSYRRKERFQVPLAVGLAGLALGLLLPPPPLRWPRRRALEEVARKAAVLLLASALASPAAAQVPPHAAASSPPPAPAAAEPPPDGSPTPGGKPTRRSGTVLDELLLRPRRATEEGRAEYARGSHPQALSAFERAAAARPQDPATRFNVADGLYKNGKYDEAAAIYRALGADAASPVAAPSRYNLGNSLYQKQDYRGRRPGLPRRAARGARRRGHAAQPRAGAPGAEGAAGAAEAAAAPIAGRTGQAGPERPEAGPEATAAAGSEGPAEGPEATAAEPAGAGEAATGPAAPADAGRAAGGALPAGGRDAEGAGHAAPGRPAAE